MEKKTQGNIYVANKPKRDRSLKKLKTPLVNGDTHSIVIEAPQEPQIDPKDKNRLIEELNKLKGISVPIEEPKIGAFDISPFAPLKTEYMARLDGTAKYLDQIDFFDEKNNKLTIKFSCNSRKYRVQVFLNDVLEIRPVTYTGTNTGYAFWNLLKGALIK